MQLAIIGSRTFNDYANAKQWIDRILSEHNLPVPTQIVSGGAKGADAIAERYAHEHGIELQVFKADWTKYGRGAGPVRNREIIRHARHFLALWDMQSKGTRHSIETALGQGKPVYIVNIADGSCTVRLP